MDIEGEDRTTTRSIVETGVARPASRAAARLLVNRRQVIEAVDQKIVRIKLCTS